MIDLGTVSQVDIRAIWKDEAKDFTPWLLQHSKLLSEAIGLDLELTESEHPVGKFSLDLIGTTADRGERVIVENQLERSDHTHFGQLMTYAGGTDAKYVIWIASEFREEYVAALRWLNEGTTEEINFFAVEISAIKIGDSKPAPLFKVVVEPNNWSKETKASAAGTLTPRGSLQNEFWLQFLSAVKRAHPNWTSMKKGQPQHWLNLPAGLPEATYSVCSTGSELRSEFVLWSKQAEFNEIRFQYLLEHKEEIEAAFGGTIVWHSAQKQRILRITTSADFMNQDSWSESIEWLISRQELLRNALAPHLKELKKMNLSDTTG